MKKATLIFCTTLLSLCFWTPKVTAQNKVPCVSADKVLENSTILTSTTCIHLSKEMIDDYSETEFEGSYDAFLIYGQSTDKYPTAMFFIQPAEYGYGIIVAEFYLGTTDIEREAVLFAQGEAIG